MQYRGGKEAGFHLQRGETVVHLVVLVVLKLAAAIV